MPDHIFTVSLVGRRLPDNENLGIGHLRAALQQASIPSSFHVLNVAEDLDGVLRQVLDSGSTLVGLALSDGGSAHLPLTLGQMLHRRGWSGHVVAGGPFATLARHWLLERYGWLDSVVRFRGEVPIVQLATSLRDGTDHSHIPGLTTRRGDGLPAPVMDTRSLHTWPVRDVLPVLAGRPVANIATSRGCRGRCGYCGPASLQDAEVADGLALGHDRKQLTRRGVGGIQRRRVDDLCDEMAHLYHQRGVRYFNLVDEHPLPWNEQPALAFLAAWKQGLDRRGVGPIGIGTMMRADRITDRIARAFVDVGLVRAFLGIELGTEKEARLYGRPFMAKRAVRILQILRTLDVATVSNLMLIHPESTPSSIRAGIALLDTIPCAVETTRMQVYHGTRLHRRMARQGRLQGNPLRYSYRIDDPCMQRFDEIFTRLRIEAFGDHSAAYASHDVSLALCFTRRVGDPPPPSLFRRSRLIEDRLRSLQVRTLHDALVLARHGAGFMECGELVRRTRTATDELRRDMQQISRQVRDPGDHRPLFSHVRAAATTALQVVMLTSPMASCHRSHLLGDADTDVIEDVVEEELPPCTYEEISPIYSLARETVQDAVPCFAGQVSWEGGTLDAIATAWDSSGCMTEQTEAILEELEQDAVEAMQGLDLIPEGCEMPGHAMQTNVYGDAETQVSDMTAAVQDACTSEFGECGWYLEGIVVVVDSDGHVADVYASDWCTITDEALDCILTALSGLTFPCLAGRHICPEPVLLD